jgi:hypothetical protein
MLFLVIAKPKNRKTPSISINVRVAPTTRQQVITLVSKCGFGTLRFIVGSEKAQPVRARTDKQVPKLTQNSNAKILHEVDIRYRRYTSTTWLRPHPNEHAEGSQEVFFTHKENQK